MADVNWSQFRCNMCLTVGLAAASVASSAVAWLLIRADVPIPAAVVLFFVIWAVLGLIVDGYCNRQAQGAAARARSTTSDDEDGQADRTEAEAAERAGAEEAARMAEAEAERGAAERRAEAEAARQAEEDATRRAEAERVAAEEAARVAGAGTEVQATVDDLPGDAGDIDRDGDGIVEGTDEGTRPATLPGPRGGTPDDLKRIRGIGPKLESVCHDLGFYHFDQIAAWTPDEVAWVNSNLEGFRGRVTRDDWVAQARVLAGGGETDFSKRVDDGDVPSSQ